LGNGGNKVAKNLTLLSSVDSEPVREMWLPIGLSILLTIGTYWTMFFYAADKWASSDDHSHGPFIPIASLYLVWHIRKQLAALPRQGSAWGLVLIGVALLLHCLGIRSEIYRLSMLSFIPMLYGLVLFFAGKQWMKALLFPIGFLIFAFPFPIFVETVTFPLKIFVAKVSVYIMEQMGLSVYREGTVIHLPNLAMGVEDACSGLRSIFLVASVSAFYAYRFFERFLKRVAFFCLALPIAVVSNLIRVLFTGLAGYYLGDGPVFHAAHDASGLIVLVVAGISLVVADAVLTRVGKKLKIIFPSLRGADEQI